MSKISPREIFAEHLQTFCELPSQKVSKADLSVFYGLPLICGLGCFWTNSLSDRGFYGISISFFGIFVALLLNFQVVLFSIHQRKWTLPDDKRSVEMQSDRLIVRSSLLRELNANISYGVLISTAALSIYVILYGFDLKSSIPTIISGFLYSHIVLLVIMVAKRSFILFANEYNH